VSADNPEAKAAPEPSAYGGDWPHPSPPPPAEPDLTVAEGQVLVTSPTGTKSVVPKEAVASLKTQGYRVG
jgi:hypothetical protein